MQSDSTTTNDGNIGPALWSVALAGVLLTLVCPWLFGRASMLSTAIGAALAVLNLWAIARIVKAFLGAQRRASWGPLGMIKLAALFVVLGFVLKSGWAHVLPLALGYAALPLGIVLSQLVSTSPAGGEN